MVNNKNVNVVDIINKTSGQPKPTGQGIPDEYVTKEGYQEYPRDEREHLPIDVIDGDETKPVDGDDIITRLKRVENAVAAMNEYSEDFNATVTPDEPSNEENGDDPVTPEEGGEVNGTDPEVDPDNSGENTEDPANPEGEPEGTE